MNFLMDKGTPIVMSKKDETVSNEVRDEAGPGSVFDFLYQDRQRVASFLSQFDDSGYLERVTQSDSILKDAGRGFKLGVGGGVAALGSGEVSLERGPGNQGGESSTREYDPVWANSLTLLDFLTERNLINRSLTDSRIGQFVLVSGELEIINIGLLQKVWDEPILMQAFRQGAEEENPIANRKERRSNRKHSKAEKPVSEIDMAISVIRMLPHSIQGVLSNGCETWFSLLPEGLSIRSDDIFLKHGTSVAGQWFMLGVLDAVPDPMSLQDQSGISNLNSSAQGEGLVSNLVKAIAPIARLTLGRPSSAYGMTPILIFRQIE